MTEVPGIPSDPEVMGSEALAKELRQEISAIRKLAAKYHASGPRMFFTAMTLRVLVNDAELALEVGIEAPMKRMVDRLRQTRVQAGAYGELIEGKDNDVS